MAKYTQDTRLAEFQTPVGTDKLVVKSFHGTEGLSELFEYRFEVINEDNTFFKFDDALGKNCTLTIRTIEGEERHFDGILTEARWLAGSNEGAIYQLVLRPWLWLLSKRANSLIFHEKTAPQIIKEVFEKHGGLAKFKVGSSTRNYPVLEYCAQYRESDMAFVCRLMEQHGISYHFTHEKGEHTLVMGDDASAYKPVSGSTRPFYGIDARHLRDTEHFSLWQPERRFTTGKVTLNDYDFKKPQSNLIAEKTGDAAYENGQLEEYDYPGSYVVQSDGMDYAQIRLDAHRAEDGHYYGEGDCSSLYPGCLVTLTQHPDDGQNEQYLVLRCSHTVTGENYRSGGDAPQPYVGRYEFMRADKPYAPPFVTDKPYIRGPQTAEVIGDGEIDVDEWGRILVRFHWDREDDQSRRVRVAHVWAGKNWGAVFTPRVGMEAVVEFLEGDPDEPLIVGCVYNNDNKHPYAMPDQKNIAGWKSNSTTGGNGYNEFIMDDTAGSELVRLHAQNDLDSTVEHDEKRHVLNDRKTNIDNDDKLEVGNELYIKAGNKITLIVGGSSIVMDGQNIKIDSPNVKINAQFSLETKSNLTAKHEAGVNLTINAAMVNIN